MSWGTMDIQKYKVLTNKTSPLAGFFNEKTSIVYSIGVDLQSRSKRSNDLIIMNY